MRRLTLHVSPGVPEGFLEELREVVCHHPGEHELLLAVGERRLVLGEDFRVSAVERLPDRAVRASTARPRVVALNRAAAAATLAGWRPSRRRPRPSCTSAGSAAPSATGRFTPRAASQSGCQFLYLYDDEETGRRFMGCMNKVFRGEIDVELFEQAERTRHGLRRGEDERPAAAAVPRDGRARLRRLQRGVRLRESGVLPKPTIEDPDPAFDLRDGL